MIDQLQSNRDEETPPEIMIEEVEKAINKLKARNAPGLDNITAEEIQAATQGSGLEIIHKFCNHIWKEEIFPDEWKRAIITPIYKKKDKTDCGNYRGISLLCHFNKVFTSILLERIKKRTEEILGEEQAGFRPSRSTIDQIFTLRQMATKYSNFCKMYVCYIDFRKAFDSIWRKGLWKVMRHMGYPEKIIRILESLYKGSLSAVRTNGDIGEWFETIVGVLQGCMLSPLLFNIFLEIIMAMALKDVDAGALINGSIINNLRFADDIAATAESQDDLQMIVDNIVKESSNMGMRVNIEKTEVQCIGAAKKQMSNRVYKSKIKR